MSEPHAAFTAMWHEQAPRVMAFARRHVGEQLAQDVVAETFLIAWRRWHEVPTSPTPWLLVTARRVIGNKARAARRHRALAERVALLDSVAAYVGDTAEAALSRREALQRLAELDEQHREALLLVSWDGLSNEEAAAVLGVKPATFRRRISRARAALLRDAAPSTTDCPALITIQET